jgi:hypothetical protein
MYHFYMLKQDGAKVIECAIARDRAEAAKVMNEYFADGSEISEEDFEQIDIVAVETIDGETIAWERYQEQFQKAQYWGYFDLKTKAWNRIIQD